MRAQLDHLVIAAASLAEGVAWCEATLGLTPGPGGSHPLMGTHNRLLNIASAAFPQAYLEIIAIEPGKRPSRPCRRRRAPRGSSGRSASTSPPPPARPPRRP